MSDTNIAKAILAAQRAVAPLTKNKTAKVDSQRGAGYEYKFVPGEQIVAHGLDALHEAGCSWESWWEPFELQGNLWLRVYVRIEHPESGESRERSYPMPVKGRGDLDKALAGALTYAKGYGMAALLGIVREDEAKQHPDRRRRELGEDDKLQGRSAKEADAAIEQARAALTRAAKAYAAEAKEQGVKARPWLDVAGEAIGHPWLVDASHTIEEYTAARQLFEKSMYELRAGAGKGAAA